MARRRGRHAAETRGDRVALAHNAGMGRVSLVSVLAGVLVAYGTFAVLLAVAAAAAESAGLDTNLTADQWRAVGPTGLGILAGLLFVCYLFGGYVAGRMARRAGVTNGVLVFVVGVLVAAGVAGLVNVFTDADDVLRNLRSLGIPTSGDEWRALGTVAGAGALACMLLGAVIGGALGDRWHTKLLLRAADPSIGPAAEARAAVERHRHDLREAEERARERRLEEPVNTSGPATPRPAVTIPVADQRGGGGSQPAPAPAGAAPSDGRREEARR